jgi:hypothetical protein
MTTAETRPDHQWIQTYTGKKFWPLDPRPDEICIEDIAHALSQKCRYTGHCREFYSVAQHSVLVASQCEDPVWGLLHDAGEAYLPDVARPVKRAIPEFQQIEDRILKAVAERFGLSWPIPDCVHETDVRLLATEKLELMGTPPSEWFSLEQVEPLDVVIVPWTPPSAEVKFLKVFHDLMWVRG